MIHVEEAGNICIHLPSLKRTATSLRLKNRPSEKETSLVYTVFQASIFFRCKLAVSFREGYIKYYFLIRKKGRTSWLVNGGTS